MSELKKILENFCKLDGVRGALVVDADGGIRDSVAEKPIDAERIASLVSACSHLGRKTAAELHLDAVTQSYVDYENFSVTSEAIGDLCLVIVADPGANLGRIRLEIRKNKKVIESAGE